LKSKFRAGGKIMGSTARKIFVEPRRKRADLSDYTFTYNANADVLEATITQPLQAVLTGQDLVTLAADGTYQTLPAKAYKLATRRSAVSRMQRAIL
jgi:hypothetical protein